MEEISFLILLCGLMVSLYYIWKEDKRITQTHDENEKPVERVYKNTANNDDICFIGMDAYDPHEDSVFVTYSNGGIRTVSCICDICQNYLGSIRIHEHSFINIESDNIDKEDILSIIKRNTNMTIKSIEYGFDAYCEKCNKITHHYTVDDNLCGIITRLNEAGYKTLFSCEQHNIQYSNEFTYPYIAFSEYYDGLFNMDDFLLRFFNLENYRGKGWTCGMVLRLSNKAPIEYMTNKEYISDLNEYLDNRLNIKEEQ